MSPLTPEIGDAVAQRVPVQVLLQQVGKTLAGIQTEARRDAVAEADYSRTWIGGWGRWPVAPARVAIRPLARASGGLPHPHSTSRLAIKQNLSI